MENGMSKQFYKVLSEIKKELNHLKEKHSDDYYFEIIVSYELFMMLLDDMKTKSNLQIGNPEIYTLFGYPLKVNYENEYEFSYMIHARKVGNSLMNKYLEALETLSYPPYDSSCGGCKCGESDCSCERRTAIETLQELVDKATPKKYAERIEYVDEIQWTHAICPNCKEVIDEFEYYPYCPNCGQAISWENEQ